MVTSYRLDHIHDVHACMLAMASWWAYIIMDQLSMHPTLRRLVLGGWSLGGVCNHINASSPSL